MCSDLTMFGHGGSAQMGLKTASLETNWETKLPARALRPELGWGQGAGREKPSASGDPGNCEYYIPESLGWASAKLGLWGEHARQQPVMAQIKGWNPPSFLLPIRVLAPGA